MKRTDKYRDSYKYDDQYQNHRKRSEEDMYRQHQESQQIFTCKSRAIFIVVCLT
jgi:hypothetical protein